jgi:hypothetical protein
MTTHTNAANAAKMVFEKSVCFSYLTRVFSAEREAGCEVQSLSRRRKDVQEILDSKHIRPLNSFKQEAFRACRSYGTKLEILDAWVVPEENEDALFSKLTDIGERFDEFKEEVLIKNYKTWVSEYARANPAEALDIIALAPPLDWVARKTRFAFTAVRYTSSQIRAKNLDLEVTSLAEQGMAEIASEIKDAKLQQSTSYTQSAVATLERLRRKAAALSYLHPRLAEFDTVLGGVLSQVPKAGIVKDADALAIKTVVDAVLNPAGFMAFGFGGPSRVQHQLQFSPPAIEAEVPVPQEPVIQEPEPVSRLERDQSEALTSWGW